MRGKLFLAAFAAALLFGFAGGVVTIVGKIEPIYTVIRSASGMVRLWDPTAKAAWQETVALFRSSPAEADVVMLGDSITGSMEWAEWFPSIRILNRGIGGDSTSGVLQRVEEIASRKPARVFVMIGLNDLYNGVSVDTVAENHKRVLASLAPSASVVVLQSILPTRGTQQLNAKIKDTNIRLSELCRQVANCRYLDLSSIFSGQDGMLNADLTTDSIHLTHKGYEIWRDAVGPLMPRPRTHQVNRVGQAG